MILFCGFSKNLWASHITLWSSSLRLFRNGCLPPKIIMYLAVVCIKETCPVWTSDVQSIERFQNGGSFARDIGLSCLLKCVVWISFCPAVSFSRSKRYRCTEISADIDADRPGTNSLYEGTHINTCHGCQLSWTIYMMWRSSSGKCVVNTMIKKSQKENPPWVGDVQNVSPPPSRLAKSGH